jgi:hypothetical protein
MILMDTFPGSPTSRFAIGPGVPAPFFSLPTTVDAAAISFSATAPVDDRSVATAFKYLCVPIGTQFDIGAALETIYQNTRNGISNESPKLVASRKLSPILGAVDKFTTSSITGWVLDPRTLTDAVTVRLKIDGQTRSNTLADTDRSDLLHLFGASNHGYTVTFPVLAPGTHTVALYAERADGTEILLASKAITLQSPPLFDEAWYLAHNPDVAAAVASGKIASGWAHFIQRGQYENRSPSAYFDANYYLVHNPDVAAAVASHRIASAWAHFIKAGIYEGRAASPLFDEQYYRASNPDVAAAIAAGRIRSGLEHYLLMGQYENRQPLP